jgi:hypothetical protein
MKTRFMTEAERQEIAAIERRKKAEVEAAAHRLFGSAAGAKHLKLDHAADLDAQGEK